MHERTSSEHPISPELPPEVAEFLRDKAFACFLYPTDRGTAMLIKAPRADIDSAAGTVPIALRHELYEHPTAPVIRLLTTIYDRPNQPLALEAFVNVEDVEQRADYQALSRQDTLFMLFYDEEHQHRLTKQVAGLDHARINEILDRALAYFESLPEDQFSFEIAKAAVVARTML